MSNAEISQLAIQVGCLMMAKPKNFEPRPESSNKIGHHLVVVLTAPDEENKVKVASISHSHPGNPPQQPTSLYNLPVSVNPLTRQEGTVNVGEPKVIDYRVLKATKPPSTMEPEKFAALLAEIRLNCSDF